MPLFKKKKAEPKEGDEENMPTEAEKRMTSNTENLLVMTRREATEKLQQAQKAERTYKNRKRAGSGRESFKACKDHFKAAARELKLGFVTLFRAIKAVPNIVGDKQNERRRSRALASRKKLEEQLAKTEALEAEKGAEAKESSA
ncbi:unnamed protein product [Clonostachys chloroleuca]|uniref:Uncharacterized protein n=1 Tax=Clonostachys chloroleuca TaxID=1926264 RepID=A0AA35M8F7_9HYPO|nr:unnamed protein product [Clonostachys chloroleuca]